MKRGSAGFTLLEAVAMVAIIGALTAVALPMFSGSREEARAASCAANLSSLQSRITVLSVQNRSVDKEQLKTLIEQELPEYTCPGGGTYSVYEAQGQYTVLCSVHSMTNVALSLRKTMETMGLIDQNGLRVGKATRIDSTSTKGTYQATLNDILKTNLAAIGGTSWSVRACTSSTNGETTPFYRIFWTETAIDNLPSGTYVTALRYNTAGNFGGYYSVCRMQVTTLTQNGETYQILDTDEADVLEYQLSKETTLDKSVLDNVQSIYDMIKNDPTAYPVV